MAWRNLPAVVGAGVSGALARLVVGRGPCAPGESPRRACEQEEEQEHAAASGVFSGRLSRRRARSGGGVLGGVFRVRARSGAVLAVLVNVRTTHQYAVGSGLAVCRAPVRRARYSLVPGCSWVSRGRVVDT